MSKYPEMTQGDLTNLPTTGTVVINFSKPNLDIGNGSDQVSNDH